MKDSDEQGRRDVSRALEKQLEFVSVERRGWEAVLQNQDPRFPLHSSRASCCSKGL